MAKAPKAHATVTDENDGRIALDLRPAALDRARNHLNSRLRRLIVEGVHSAFDPGAVYRTVRDIQALDMISASMPDTAEPAPAKIPSVEESAEAQRQAQEAHKAKEERDASR